jgi:hypothetical protein
LAQMAPQDRLWHLLMHIVLQHSERCGAIRDQLLIRSTAGECTEAEMTGIRKQIGSSQFASSLRTVLDQATAGPGELKGAADAYFALSATRYACATAIFAVGATPSVHMWRPLKDLTLAVGFNRKWFSSYVKGLTQPAPAISRRLSLVGRWPRLAHLVLVGLRSGRLTILALPAMCLALKSRRVARSLQGRLTLPEPQTSVNHIVPATDFRRTVSSQPLQPIGATHE